MNEQKGISLIALIILIIVMVIIASIVLSQGDSNTISKAQEAVFKSDVKNIQEQLGIYVSSNYALQSNFNSQEMYGKVSDYLTKIDKYDEEIEVFGGLLVYVGEDKIKREIAKSLGLITEIVTINDLKFNKPDISSLPETTTYAINFDDNNDPYTIPYETAITDNSWYDYSNQKWANIKTTNNENEAYWVWIPRYAYKIDNPGTTTAETINIKFLAGTSNIPTDGETLPSDYLVHPAFTFGDTELTGIWFAKFEASSDAPDTVDGSNRSTGGGNVTTLQVRVLPDVYSWRNIYTGNAQKVCMDMTSSSGSIGTTDGVDTHLMKNIEWGAVTYLANSIYGKNAEIWINPYGANTYKMKTGYAGASASSGSRAEGHAELVKYNTPNGQKASTTGNVYGVYDMSGGASEYTAAYINNGNSYLNSRGTTTFFASNVLKPAYAKYYDIYEPGDDEKSGGLYFGSNVTTIWNANNSLENNTIRKNMTDISYENSANIKGDFLYDVSSGANFYGKNSGNSYAWLKNASDASTNYVRGWYSDYLQFGHGSIPWFVRGGSYSNGTGAGIGSLNCSNGSNSLATGFRPVLVTAPEI